MTKTLASALLSVVLLGPSGTLYKDPIDTPHQKPLLRTIIIDAGHGGDATGAKGNFSMEKDICLAVALKLGKKMEAEFPDVKIHYTRTEDLSTPNRW
ncbi:MAG: N-acetylmuramoyl-L-alanine amidase, partial [Chitinophagaceae bacterium]